MRAAGQNGRPAVADPAQFCFTVDNQTIQTFERRPKGWRDAGVGQRLIDFSDVDGDPIDSLSVLDIGALDPYVRSISL